MWTICERSSTSLALHTTTTVTATGAATATATATATVTATATAINNAAIGSEEVGTSICSQQEKLADIEHISTIAGSLVSIGTISHIHPPRYGTNDAGYDTEHTSLNSDFDETELRRELLRDKWKLLFDMFDPEGFGEITVDEFINALKSPEFITQVPMNKRELLLERAKKAKSPAGPGYVTFQDFVNVMSGKRTRSFKCAVHHRDREVCSENDFHLILEEPPLFQRMLQVIALELLPDKRDRKYYADRYTCCPPPWFIVFITLIELSLFAFHAISMRKADLLDGSIPICLSTSTSYSLLIYRPDKRYELWRFVTYMFLHDGWCHLGFNLLIQLLLGLPLEMVHGSARLASIYFSGVLAGSLGTSIIDPEVCLVGASGGAYALLAAHLANVMINYHQMRYGVLRLAVILFFASCDVGFAVYTRYAEDYPAVSFIAHLSGALSGLTIGLLVLKNFEQKLHEQLLWWIALGIYTACIIFAIIFNIINSAVMQSLKVEQIYVTETFYNGFQV